MLPLGHGDVILIFHCQNLSGRPKTAARRHHRILISFFVRRGINPRTDHRGKTSMFLLSRFAKTQSHSPRTSSSPGRFWRTSRHMECLSGTFGHFGAKVSNKEGSCISAEARLYIDRFSGGCRGAQLRLVSRDIAVMIFAITSTSQRMHTQLANDTEKR